MARKRKSEEEYNKRYTAADNSFEEVEVGEDAERRREERRERRRKRKDEQRKKRRRRGKILVLLLLLILLIVGCVFGTKIYAQMTGESILNFLPSLDQIPFVNEFVAAKDIEVPVEETEPATTEAPTTAAVETTEKEEANVALKRNENREVLKLVQDYYEARLIADFDAMSQILVKDASINKNEILAEKEVVEAYDDVAVYVAGGMEEGEYAVYVTYGMRFTGIENAAPGMEPAYVLTQEDGSLKLAFYRDFDVTTKNFMNSLSASTAVTALAEQVHHEYQVVQEADPELKAFLTGLAEKNSSGDASEGSEESAEAEAQADTTTENGIEFKTVDEQRYTTSTVKCRKLPNLEENAEFKLLDQGTKVHVVGTSDKWFKVVLSDGYKGYIAKDYLTTKAPQ